MQAEAGFMALTGEPDGPPTRMGLSMVDFSSGMMMAIGLLAALLDAQRTGIGRDVDVDLLSSAVHLTTYPAYWYLNEGDATERTTRSAHPSVTPSQLFRSADGWVFVMAQLPKFWTILTERIGRPELAEDARFDTPAARLANRDALTEVLDSVFSTAPTAHWMSLLAGHMPVAPVYGLGDAMDNPFLQQTGMIDVAPHPDRPDMRVLASPVRLDGARSPARAAPLLGADSDDILESLGYDQAAVAKLRQSGIV
jgi:crotonobetainyl-CoA:carnitine CoA-transferase CaiB-like acyl-CoA transferase